MRLSPLCVRQAPQSLIVRYVLFNPRVPVPMMSHSQTSKVWRLKYYRRQSNRSWFIRSKSHFRSRICHTCNRSSRPPWGQSVLGSRCYKFSAIVIDDICQKRGQTHQVQDRLQQHLNTLKSLLEIFCRQYSLLHELASEVLILLRFVAATACSIKCRCHSTYYRSLSRLGVQCYVVVGWDRRLQRGQSED